MKSSLTSRRPALAAVLVLAVAVVSAGCAAAGSSSAPAPAASASSRPTATSSTRIPLAIGTPASSKQAALEAILPSLTTCMKAQGMPLASSATGKQVRQAFVALPLATQERDFKACEHVMPASVRQVIANDLAEEKAMAK